MIKSWQRKGLKRFYETGLTSGIQSQHANRLKIILQRLDSAIQPEDLDLPNMRLHRLKGKAKDYYAVTVNKNWRVIFQFEEGHAILIDYVDYH